MPELGDQYISGIEHNPETLQASFIISEKFRKWFAKMNSKANHAVHSTTVGGCADMKTVYHAKAASQRNNTISALYITTWYVSGNETRTNIYTEI